MTIGGIPPAKPVGGFVVGLPTKDVRTFQTENPTVAIDGVFLKLVSAEEFDEVRRRLQIPLGTDLKYQQSISGKRGNDKRKRDVRMAQREQVLDRAQRLQQAFVNGNLWKQARQRLGLYSRSIGLFKRRSYRNSPKVTVLMYRHLPVASAGKSPWPKCPSTSKRGAGIDREPNLSSYTSL